MQLGLIPIYCINLQKHPERFQRVKKRLNNFDLRVIRWNASTPETKCDYNFVHYLNGGSKACTISHLNLYKHILTTNADTVLILEDDASFRHDWKDIVNTKLSTIEQEDPHWDCIFLNVAEEIEPVETWTKISNQCLSAGYIINRRGINFILDHFKNMYYCIDWMTQILQSRGHSYSYFPWLIIQENHKSDTKDTDDNHDYAKVLRLLNAYEYPIINYDLTI